MTQSKQFKPTIYNISDYKSLPALSVFSLTNSINKKTLQSYPKQQKVSDILEFVPHLKWVACKENQKLISIPQAIGTYSKNQTNSVSILNSRIFPRHRRKRHTDSKLLSKPTKYSNHLFSACVDKNHDFQPPSRLHFKPVSSEDAATINSIVKLTKWLINENKTTNENLVYNNWKENFKSNLFDSTYRPKRKTLFTHKAVAWDYKISLVSPAIKSSLNGSSMFYDKTLNIVRDTCNSTLENSVFFPHHLALRGVGFSKRNVSSWKKIQKQLSGTWFFRKIAFPQATPFLSTKSTDLTSPYKNKTEPFFETDKKFQQRQWSKKENHAGVSQSSSFLWIKANIKRFNNVKAWPGGAWPESSIQKRRSKIRFLLRVPTEQKIYSLNRFQIALCFSKILQRPIFFNESYRFNSGRWPVAKDVSRVHTNFDPDRPLYHPSPSIASGKKKNWYTKSQFFQYLSWSMKHNHLNGFLKSEDSLHTSLKEISTKPSYQSSGLEDKEGFENRIKITEKDFKTMPFTNKIKSENESINPSSFWSSPPTPLLPTPYKGNEGGRACTEHEITCLAVLIVAIVSQIAVTKTTQDQQERTQTESRHPEAIHYHVKDQFPGEDTGSQIMWRTIHDIGSSLLHT